jgi:Na+-transporting NADH:ubiquinone oxidoreductase subunit C
MPDGKAFSRDSIGNTLTVAVSLSLVCSILVAGTSVMLKPRQERNENEFRQRIILEVASLMEPGADIETLFAGIEPRLVELSSGDYIDDIDAESFDTVAAANDPDLSIAIPADLDTGNIRRRAIYAPVYLVKSGREVEQIILPVHGAGLWSTMYGYLALQNDGTTVNGLRFYSHAETPGLGDQIDDPDWRAQWVGKTVHGSDGEPRIEVVRGLVGDSSDAAYQIDGLSGATLTGRGVSDLVRYWTGPHGFGPYLSKYWNADE